jgi:hypothetical protein
LNCHDLRSMMRPACRLALGLVGLVVAACQGPSSPPPAPAPPPAAATVGLGPPAAPPPAPAERELCDVLPAVLATEAGGFARLRTSPIAADSWRGARTLPGTERCTIEGDAWPRARYTCASRPYLIDNRDRAKARFESFARTIDECLKRPIWFPRSWQKGEPFEFAMGERLQTWTDESISPPTQVVLKMQQDLDRRGYQLKLNLESIH